MIAKQNTHHPEFLAIGHATYDLHPPGPFSPLPDPTSSTSSSTLSAQLAQHSRQTIGGTVTFAALTAANLGLHTAIVTCADPQLATALATALPTSSLHIRPSNQSTTFVNQYQAGFRTQYLPARAASIQPTDIPVDWLQTPIILLGPVAQEIDAQFVSLFPRRSGTIIAATPQGWLRRWDPDGRVWPTPWLAAEQILPALDVLILSHDDLLPFSDGIRAEADALLQHWSHFVPLLVATDGRQGATLFQHGTPQRFPAYPAHEVDPTGAGDVFAAAFLTHLYRHHDPARAVEFANCAASLSIEQPDIQGIPTLAMVEQRLPTNPNTIT